MKIVASLAVVFCLFFIVSFISMNETVFHDDSFTLDDEIRFCFVGDFDLKDPSIHPVADALRDRNCDRIVFLGDLIYPKGITSRKDPEFHWKFMHLYEPILRKNPETKILLLLGNHDYQGSSSPWLELAKSDSRFFYPHKYYLIDYGGLCLTVFDSNLYYYGRFFLDAISQTVWFLNLGNKLDSCKVKVALSHHPYKGTDQTDRKWEGAQGALKLFFKNFIVGEFDLHAAGHLHLIQDDGQEEGTHFLISGTGGGESESGAVGFLVISWNPKTPENYRYFFEKVSEARIRR